jgi:hypothetical protein
MRYNIDTILPEDAFKKDPLGRIKLHGGGGGGSSQPAYNPYKDKQYIEQKQFLDTLKADIEKNNKKMTPDEIIAALSPAQRAIINQQSNIVTPSNVGSWGLMNNAPTTMNQPIIAPPMQQSNQFGYDPQSIIAIQKLLSNSSFLPATSSNSGNIGGK